ncbi:MAG: DUF3500 domain-containing protein [Chloroflexota bacterium]|nr:DUF3500 domain-containing protein [Chloroflexota bacterium]
MSSVNAHLTGSASPTGSAQAGPWTGGDVPLASRSSRQMAVAARALLNGLGADQLGSVWYPNLSDPARTRWSNLPAGASPRPGVSLGDLSDSQRVLLHDLLRASTSSQGYHKMTAAIRADEVLHDLDGERLFGPAFYYTSVFGSPEDANWAWMLTGHHMSAVFTVAGDRTAFTPMFTGSQPLQIPRGIYAGWQVLPQDAARASELLSALSTDQQNVAILSTSAPGDVVAGPGRQASLASVQGISAGQLDDAQQRLLWLLVQEFVSNADFDAADAQLALVRESWGNTHFAWQGPPGDPTARFYFRVHGPRILIEYDVQEPLTKQGGHVHAITRDPTNDYGMDWLGLHYQE